MTALGDISAIEHNINYGKRSSLKVLTTIICGNELQRLNRVKLKAFRGFAFDEESDDFTQKINDLKTKLTLVDLVSVCHVLDIDHDGSEDVILKRILSFLCNVKEKDDQENNDDDEEEEEEEDDGRKTQDADTSVYNVAQRPMIRNTNRSIIDGCDEDDVRSSRYDAIQTRLATISISFRDMEGSVRRFNGKDGYPISKWIEDLEETAEIAGWTDLQKLLFGKKMLDGLAKLLVQAERGITSWDKFKELLKQEFEEKINSAEIHRLLMTRRKKHEETVKEYVLVMREIASRGLVAPEVTIQYIIDGIPDDPGNKMVLYGSKTYEELKEKIKLYDMIKKRIDGEKKKERNQVVSKGQFNKVNKNADSKYETPTTRCYSCGERGHLSRECPAKEKGLKCFGCNKFGHKSAECPNKIQRSSANDAMLIEYKNNRATKNITLNDKTMLALFDTGSDVNLIRRENYSTLNFAVWTHSDPITLTGIGGKKVDTLGCLRAEIIVDNVTINTIIHVVPDDTLKIPVVLGQEYLSNVVFRIDTDGINITSKPVEDELQILRVEYNEPELDVDHIRSTKLKNEIRHLYENYDPNKKTKETPLKMKIVLKDETPIFQRPRRLAHHEKIEVNAQMDEWLREGIIRPSHSEFVSPIVLVRKKDGTVRICQDYRKLNQQIIKDRYPLPLIEDQLDRLQGSLVYSTLDLRNGFFHVPVEEESRKYTSFITPTAQYEFNKTPFGLCNSPSTFQRFINQVFKDHIKNGILLTYMDDLVILAQNEEEAVARLREVLKTAEAYGLRIQWKKCQFLKTSIEYLGHHIENGRIRPSTSKTDAVARFPRPTTIKQVQSFLGLTGYFRKFIENYSLVAKPLTDLLKENRRFEFGEKETKSFERLKEILARRPTLGIYDVNAETELHTDACIDGYGAILLQKNENGALHPIYYMSRKTAEAERKYTSYELEVLAVIYALKKFRVYLLGLSFKIVTDCSAFALTMKKEDLSTRVARWVMLLSEFNYVIEHRPSSRMKHVDALSRNSLMIISGNDTIESIKSAQAKDEHLQVIVKILNSGHQHKDYVMKNDLLYKNYDGRDVLVVPAKMQEHLVRKYHEENGHFNVKKTKDLLLREFWLPNLQAKIEACIQNCVPCILAERKSGKAEGFLHPIAKDELPLCTYHVDHLGPMASTNKGYKYLLVVVDGFTKFTWLYPVKTLTSQEVLTKMETQKNVFGNPKRIIADRGTAFTSNVFQDYCKLEKIDLVHITTGVARANGQVERINRIIIPILTKLSLQDETKWYKYVNAVQTAINNTYQRCINTSPFELLFGVQPRQTSEHHLQEIIEAEYQKNFTDDREDLRKTAKQQILRVQEENKKNFNKRRKPARIYEVDDWVAIKRIQFTNLAKLKSKFLGPYRVVAVKSHDRYDVERVGAGDGPKKTSTAADYMKPWAWFVHGDEAGLSVDHSDPEDGIDVRNGRDVGFCP